MVANQEESPESNARVGYEAAVHLWVFEGNLIWSKFNAMLVCNSVIVGALVLTYDKPGLPEIARLYLSGLGLVLTVLWFCLTRRGFDQLDYWIRSARELEESHLAPVKTVSRGESLGRGMEVTFRLDVRNSALKVGKVGKLFRAQTVANCIIFLFGAVYLLVCANMVNTWLLRRFSLAG